MAQGGGNSGDPSGLGQPGFGWGTDPKTGAYRYGKMGADGFLEPGTGAIPPTDPATARTAGNIPITNKGSGSGWGGPGALLGAVVVVLVLVIGAAVALTAARVSHAFTDLPGGNCIGGPLLGGAGKDVGGGRVRFRCAGGGTMIVNFDSGPPVVSPSPKASRHHHHQNANG